ncbi:MAG: hypothetical protein V7L06_25070 [Nostoc sp.]
MKCAQGCREVPQTTTMAASIYANPILKAAGNTVVQLLLSKYATCPADDAKLPALSGCVKNY